MRFINLKKIMARTVKNPEADKSVTSGAKRSYLTIAMIICIIYMGWKGSLGNNFRTIHMWMFACLAVLEWFSSPICEAIGNCLSKIIKRQQIKGK